ncbi:hypothetical protein HCU64_23620 [Methylobacterium sp. C25]|uniref:hypothetical protein n=1 Tax=Methylobacterium sp. C25 TaxID=2721622 RepID=UPI001F3ED1C0|nr:hypothetical protein [Methylobacterium sp. C25]MCE4226735.1 hypothetical protein [Methylobacterium sp. C25]
MAARLLITLAAGLAQGQSPREIGAWIAELQKKGEFAKVPDQTTGLEALVRRCTGTRNLFWVLTLALLGQ